MQHDTQKELQKPSLIGRIVPTEVFLLLMGIATLTYGIINSMTMSIFWGCVIIPGVILLHQIRRKDWAKHWQEMEAEHKRHEELEAERMSAAENVPKTDNNGK